MFPRSQSAMLLFGLAFGCAYEEVGLEHKDLKGVVRIPEELLYVEMENDEGEQWVIENDIRALGPIYLGVYSAVEEGHYSYLHPEMGPVLEENQPGDAYPYGGTSIGRFDWGCTEETRCKLVTGRYSSYDDVLNFFRDQVQDPLMDAFGEEYTAGEALQERCYEVRNYTDDHENAFIAGEDLDFTKNGAFWEAEVTIGHTLYREGVTVWGWADMPSYSFDFLSCDEQLGESVYYYDYNDEIGRSQVDLLNFPGQYIDYGDLVASEGAVMNDPDTEFVIELGFRNEE